MSTKQNAWVLHQIQFKIFYISLMVTTKWKPGADAPKIKKGEHNTLENQFTKVGRKRNDGNTKPSEKSKTEL